MIAQPSVRARAGLPPRVATLLALMFVAAVILYSALWHQRQVVDGDTAQYQEVARDLSNLRLETLHDRTLGFPLLLAATGASEHGTLALLVVSLLMHVAAIWLLAVVLSRAGLRERWLVIFALLLLLPPFAEPAAWIMTENLAQFALVVGTACLVLGLAPVRVGVLLLGGVAFGYAALTRPVYQALAAGLACLVLAWPPLVRKTGLSYMGAMKAGAALVVGAVLVIGSMSAVNYAKFGYFGLVPSIGFHLCTKTMAVVERLPDEYRPVREILIQGRNAELLKPSGMHNPTQAVWAVKSQLLASTGMTEPQLSAYLLKMNVWLISHAPLDYLSEVARSMAVYWFPPAIPLAAMHSSILRWLWTAMHVAWVGFFFLQVGTIAGVGVFTASRRLAGLRDHVLVPSSAATSFQALAWVTTAVIVFYTMLVTCFIDIGDPRQRRPTDILVIFLCFLGAHVWRRSLMEDRAPDI